MKNNMCHRSWYSEHVIKIDCPTTLRNKRGCRMCFPGRYINRLVIVSRRFRAVRKAGRIMEKCVGVVCVIAPCDNNNNNTIIIPLPPSEPLDSHPTGNPVYADFRDSIYAHVIETHWAWNISVEFPLSNCLNEMHAWDCIRIVTSLNSERH